MQTSLMRPLQRCRTMIRRVLLIARAGVMILCAAVLLLASAAWLRSGWVIDRFAVAEADGRVLSCGIQGPWLRTRVYLITMSAWPHPPLRQHLIYYDLVVPQKNPYIGIAVVPPPPPRRWVQFDCNWLGFHASITTGIPLWAVKRASPRSIRTESQITGDQVVTTRGMYVPIWMICLLSAPGAMLGGRGYVRRLTRRLRAKKGLCLACGFDVRASPERCPECGQAVLLAQRNAGIVESR